MIAIIDYGMGNLASVEKALNFLNLPNTITKDHSIIRSARAIILPGVGSFPQAMKNLSDAGLVELLTEEVIGKKKKFLGICLGMQLVATKGTEHEDCLGLGWIDGKIIKIEADGRRIPHLGWNEIIYKKDSYFKDLPDTNFYFIHSYHFVPEYEENIVAKVCYGQDLVAGVQKDNILAVQFHPEKSQAAGLTLLKNYFTEEDA
jgi:imidazole glycerol-phosphate synthase subunit HisH